MSTAARARAKTAPVIDPTCVSMSPRMPAQRAPHSTKKAPNGVDPRRRDVLRLTTAQAHTDAERGRTNADLAGRYSTAVRPVATRTVSDWLRIGPPEAREFTAYLLVCANPYRLEAHVRATVKMRALADKPTEQLIADYRELLAHEPEVEALDRKLDVSRGISWLDRAAASERDAAIETEKSAYAREFAARGITEEQVFGGSR